MAKPNNRTSQFKVGFIHPRSGPLANYGLSLSQGIKLGLQQFRAENPKLGESVSLVAADDRGLASESEKAAQRLLQNQGVDILIGSLSNISNRSLAAVASKNEKILVLPFGTDDEVISSPYLYSMILSDKKQGRLIAQFALKGLRRDRAVVWMDPRYPDNEAIGKGFMDAFSQGGGQVLGVWSQDLRGPKVQETLKAIADAQAQIVFVPGYYRDVPAITHVMKKAGIRATVLGSDGWDHEDLFASGTDLGSQYFFSYFHPSDPQAGVQSFVADYEQAFGSKPDLLAAQGYDAIRAVLNAYALAKSKQTAALQKAFEGGRFPSLYGAGRFSKDRIFLRTYPFFITTGNQARLMSRQVPED